MVDQSSVTEQPAQPEAQAGGPGLERGAYEVIRNRLNQAGAGLRERLTKLNQARKEVFGSIETELLATGRVTTEYNCVPRDITPLGRHFIFGYNVQMGLKSETRLADVFAVYEFREHQFHEQKLDLLLDERFQRDFKELHKYYKHTVFAKFSVLGPHMFMVFQIGREPGDIKTFKWLREGDKLTYLDNRSDHEFRYPPQHEFHWKRTHREMHYKGLHPHVSIEDRVFVETVGGDLTIKIENNTESGEGVYSEPVDNPDQTLDDAEIFYAIVGNLILLKVKPYQEEQFRYFVYSEKTRTARRVDGIKNACVLLPDDHGIIFSNGYFLQTGECKIFEQDVANMLFESRVQSPNGEDFLFTFYDPYTGNYLLLPYNLIEQRVEQPIACNGYSFFENGEMIYFKSHEEPQRHHALQIWQTPFVGADYQPETHTDSYLFKIGNKDLVRGMAECHEALSLIEKEDTYTGLYLDIRKKAVDVLDSYYWINHPEAFELSAELVKIREAAEAAIGEFDKVVSVRRNTAEQLRRVSSETRKIITEVYSRRFEVIQDFVKSLASLRAVRGDIISLRELRYIDLGAVEALENEVAENAETCAKRSVEFLLRPQALEPYEIAIGEQQEQIAGQAKVAQAKELEQRIADTAGELEMLIEVVSNLKIDDATQRTAIIDNISALFARLNQSRAELKNKIQELAKGEGAAEFASQLKLLNQSVVNYLDVCDTPEKCEEYLTKLMVALEELEGRFAEFDDFVVQLAGKRDEIYNAFETRKLQLVEKRNKRTQALMGAAERILKGIQTRVRNFETINEINGYFAADLMIEKIRDIVGELGELGDTVKVDDVQSRLKTIREDAVRQLKDKQELFAAGENAIRFGRHQFLVNVQPLDLTTVLRDGEMFFHLTGTNFFEAVADAAFLATREVWTQEIVSENPRVYRAEFLVWRMLQSFGKPGQANEEELRGCDGPRLLEFVQRFMAPRYHEAYIKGVHDRDACAILSAVLEIRATAGLLRYHPSARALARVFWELFPQGVRKTLLLSKLRGFGAVREFFPRTDSQEKYVAELRGLLEEFLKSHAFFAAELLPQAAAYLFEELAGGGSFTFSSRGRDLRRDFEQYLHDNFIANKYANSIADIKDNAASVFLLQRDWVNAFVGRRNDPLELEYADEAAALLFVKTLDPQQVVEAAVERTLEGMTGSHPLLADKKYELHYSEFMLKLSRYEAETVPRFEQYLDLKKELVERKRQELKLDEFRPRVLTSFVRNKLIDRVYLPLIGDNLAKQIGVAGEAKRTDRMGLLLLISPPGYGKTTLMEYIANRLGIIFMKINGPALGHAVTSLDPAEAPNAASREEIEKLNLALEMGDNVMLYVDDIQHCNPEFLQKFISLCDATRKIEGVYKGRTRTYDLRGKKVCVVMAGNPYTESGEQFKIPDMLANRADTYNLGEIIGGNADVFEMSYLENCLTSNPVLNGLATRSQQDVYSIIKIAQTGSQEGVEFKGNFALDEISEMVAVMKKLLRVRDVVLRVNEQYIRSAAQADAYRTEPPFKLQGSYRNMNRIAEKVVAIMNDEELEQLILANYENDAQTLTTGAEMNLLKFKELTGRLNDAERERWESIKKTFRRNVELQGVGEDQKFGQLILKLSQFNDGLGQIRETLHSGIGQLAAAETENAPEARQSLVASFDDATLKTLRELMQNLKSRAAVETRPQPQWPQNLTASFDAATLDTMRNLIGEFKTLAQAIPAVAPDSTAATPAPAAMPPIQVVTKVPRSILAVLQEQFRLMETWIEPLYRETQLQSRDIEKIVKMIEASRASYQALIDKLEKSARRAPGQK